jgi:hypothetical protein
MQVEREVARKEATDLKRRHQSRGRGLYRHLDPNEAVHRGQESAGGRTQIRPDQTQTRSDPDQTQTKPRPDPDQTHTRPRPDQTKTRPRPRPDPDQI